VISYFRRLWAFRNSTLRTPGRIGSAHRIFKLLSVVVWATLFVCAHGAGAQEAVPSGGAAKDSTTPYAIPVLPEAVPSGSGAAPKSATALAGAVTPAAPATPRVSIPTANIPSAAIPSAAIPSVATPTPASPVTPASPGSKPATIGIDLGDSINKPSNSVLIIIGLTLISLAPSLLMMMTSFTRIVIVLGLTRNAMGVQAIPPNQVVVGLALFLSLFVMAPTLSKMNEVGLQPLLRGEISQGEAFDKGTVPLKQFMLANTRRSELQMMISASKQSRPATPEKVPLTTLIPAFVLSELKTAFIIGFVIFIPFLVIDLVVSATLMALGMMMLPPAFVALPFKLLLFVMVDGWSLVAKSLVESFR
jgi:flagellar biosynthetic protein FliP